MKARESNIAGNGWRDSVLECASPLPLLHGHEHSTAPQSARGLAHSKTWRLVVTALAFVMFASMASAQSYSIDWHKIAGGGLSTNGQYSVSGTIGQHDAGGPMTGDNYSLTGGFWALIQVVQTAGAPTLFISHSGNSVTVYWQNISGLSLVQSGNLATPVAAWSANTSWTTSNGTNSLTIANPTGNLFFRLK